MHRSAAMGYANFWADKAANGPGYSLGSIATIYLTGGTGLIGGRQGSKMVRKQQA